MTSSNWPERRLFYDWGWRRVDSYRRCYCGCWDVDCVGMRALIYDEGSLQAPTRAWLCWRIYETGCWKWVQTIHKQLLSRLVIHKEAVLRFWRLLRKISKFPNIDIPPLSVLLRSITERIPDASHQLRICEELLVFWDAFRGHELCILFRGVSLDILEKMTGRDRLKCRCSHKLYWDIYWI